VANFAFDVALGREVEFYSRVDSNDPANSALIIVVLAHTGIESDSVLKQYATLSALLAASNNEVTNTNYARKTLTDADLAAYTVDTSAHSITLPLPTQTYTAIAVGDTWSKALVCYDSDTTGGTDANIIPVASQDIRLSGAPLVPNGGNITFTWLSGLLVAR
jgi:hypothetical protein